jgi:transcriptional regulator with XRE-family HTH domain
MVGDDLILWRKREGLTQRGLAQSLGVDVMTISRWERGTRGIPVLLPIALEALENRLSKEKDHGPVS